MQKSEIPRQPDGGLVVTEPLLNYESMAAELGIPVRSLRELVRKGVVPHLRLGYRTVKFVRSRVRKALQKREVREVAQGSQRV
jgi:excisionase family DNA binding protein